MVIFSQSFDIFLQRFFSRNSAMSSKEGTRATEKGKAPTVQKVKVKKPKGSKASSPSHPPYFQMIKEAILALHERMGSSPHAIAKHMEEKHKGELPANFRKILAVQLRNLAAKGKLLKVRASFKLSESAKQKDKKVVKAAKPNLATKVKKPKKSVKVGRPKSASASTPVKRKASGAVKKTATPVKTTTKKIPVLKKVKKAAPVKPKQPKSIKSPAVKRAKKAAA